MNYWPKKSNSLVFSLASFSSLGHQFRSSQVGRKWREKKGLISLWMGSINKLFPFSYFLNINQTLEKKTSFLSLPLPLLPSPSLFLSNTVLKILNPSRFPSSNYVLAASLVAFITTISYAQKHNLLKLSSAQKKKKNYYIIFLFSIFHNRIIEPQFHFQWKTQKKKKKSNFLNFFSGKKNLIGKYFRRVTSSKSFKITDFL